MLTRPPRVLHPKMAQRAQLVKQAHQHLRATTPAYHQATPQQKMRMVQAHVTSRLRSPK